LSPILRHALVPFTVAIAAGLPLIAAGAPGHQKPHAAANRKSSMPANVVATVNGEPITRAEVADTVLADQMAQLAVTDPMFIGAKYQRGAAGSVGAYVLQRMAANGWKPVTVSRAEIVNFLFSDKPPILAQTVQRMIQEKVVAQAAKKAGITLTKQEIEARTKQAFDTARRAYHRESASDAAILKAVGFRAAVLNESVITELLLEKLVLKDIEAKLGHPIGPNDWVDASHILVRANAESAADKEKSYAEALAKIQEYKKEIESGKISFEDAAQRYSDDAATKFRKGSLGLFLRGEMVPEFDKVAFELPAGKVSDPVKTVFGYHLIKVNRLGKDTTGPERAQALQNLLQKRVQQKMAELLRAAKITNTVPMPQPRMMPGQG